ncbi:MAG: hypothetical protein GXO28_04305 [Methanopyri archaeon]|nr:hypothetical protein [Methanopyri archaeon]
MGSLHVPLHAIERSVEHYLLLVAKVTPLVYLGFFVASLMIIKRVHRRLGELLGPGLARFGLTPEAAAALAASFASPSAGYPILAEFRERGVLDDVDVILLVVATTFPTVLGETFIKGPFFAALAILGPEVGLAYMGALYLASLAQTVPALLAFGWRSGRKRVEDPALELGLAEDEEVPPTGEAVRVALRRALRRTARVVPRMIAIGVPLVVFAEVVRSMLHGAAGPLLAITLANLSHYTVGYATAAEFMRRGILTPCQTVAALLVAGCANVVMIFTKASLANYVSIFGARLGVKVWAVNFAASVVSRLALAAVIWWGLC